ncbi:MAG: sensor histidine kinase [Ferruginibacter sp.]|nr:sensor histidine kinase [Ferruginibacter sp.]
MNEKPVILGDFKNTNDLYSRMVAEIQDYAIILMDKEGIIRNWNKGAQKIKQYTSDEIIGKHFSIFYLPEDLAVNMPQQLINEASLNGRSTQEGWRKRKDGSRFWGSITITALHDDDNCIIGFSKVTRDLTAKKIDEDKLRISEERYHRMIAEVQDYAIILLSPNGIIENWNIGAQNIKGYSANEVIGKRFDLFYTEEDRKNKLPDSLLDEARYKGKATQEGWRLRKNGSKFWGTIVITALHGKDGQLIGFSKVTRDLTEKKIADEKLLSYTAELEIQNSELEQFAYVASHDLQEPLRKIQTFAELIQENYTDEAFVKSYFKKLDKSAKRLSELVKSLLEYSRLSKDKNIDEYNSGVGEVDLNNIITEVKLDFELLIEEKDAIIKCAHLPTITGSAIQLGQLFSNLISNSLKFSNTKPIIEISWAIVNKNQIPNAPSALSEGKYFQISFEDNGIGFEQKYDKKIFSLFQRLHGKQDYAGTGIGLSLCKKIVENHAGTINVLSSLGHGATFDVYLPSN